MNLSPFTDWLGAGWVDECAFWAVASIVAVVAFAALAVIVNALNTFLEAETEAH